MHKPLNGQFVSAFGFLRLCFASLVIIAHVPYQMLGADGFKSSLARNAFYGFGETAVDCFFIVSGFLIAQSFCQSGSATSFMWKRIVRIYPAFCISSLICLLIVAPLGGAGLGASAQDWIGHFSSMLRLKPPIIESAFPGIPYHGLNIPTWTIAFEFRCYILAALVGLAGLYDRRMLLLAGTVMLLVANTLYRAGLADYYINVPRPASWIDSFGWRDASSQAPASTSSGRRSPLPRVGWRWPASSG